MPIDQFDFEAITVADLNELIENSVPEGLHLEYKQELYGAGVDNKKEALKDISAFANASGGHLIIGISENQGVPENLTGVAGSDPDQVIGRLESMTRDGIEPRIQGLRFKPIPVNDGRHAYVIRIPRSWNQPHRVTTQRSNRYWIRNSNGAHEASMDELRNLFTQEADARRQAIAFRDQRLQVINDNAIRLSLHNTGRLILHIIPVASLMPRFSIDLEKASQLQPLLRPHLSYGTHPFFNYDGFAIQCTVGREGHTQVFRNGIIETAQTELVEDHQGHGVIPGITVEQIIMESSASCLEALRRLGVPAPLLVFVTFKRVYGAVFRAGVGNDFMGSLADQPRIEDEPVCLPECYIQGYGSPHDYHQALRPAIDVLWNMAGHSSAQSFDSEGRWLNGSPQGR